MGLISDAFNDAWRDYITDGVPSSGVNKPAKVDIRAAGAVIESVTDGLDTRIDDLNVNAFTYNWLTQPIEGRSTGNVNLASGLVNGQVLNGLTVETGKYYFIGSQTDASENGIYVGVAAGAATRATFANTAAEIARIAFVLRGGTVGAGERWVLAMDAADITLETTDLVFSPYGVEVDYAATVTSIISSQVIGLSGTPATGTGAAQYTFVLADPVTADGYLSALRLYAMATGTISVKRFTKSGDTLAQIGPDYPITVGSTGLHTQTPSDFGNVPVKDGEYLGFYQPAAIVAYIAGGASTGYFSPGSIGNYGHFVDAAATTNPTLQIGFDIANGTLPAIKGVVDALNLPNDNQTIGRRVTPVTGTDVSVVTFVYADPIRSDSVLTGARMFASSAGSVRLRRFSKSGNNFTRVGDDHVISYGAGLNEITADRVGYFEAKAGEYIGFYADGHITFVAAQGDSGGYYSSGSGNYIYFTDAAATTTPQLQIGFDFTPGAVARGEQSAIARTVPPISFEQKVMNAGVTLDGLSYSLTVDLSWNGGLARLTDTGSLTAATSGYVRFDTIYIDATDLSINVVQGTERVDDPTAFIPAMTEPEYIPVFNMRVSSADAIAVPVWDADDGVSRTIADEVALHRQRNRARLRKTIGKIRRGDALHIVGFGDSITAIQNATPSTATPNGANRDRAAGALADTNHYLRDAYGDDIVDALPLYTAVQLGRADDGAGAVHTRIGFNWTLVAALEQLGYVLGTDLTYDNFGVGSLASDNAVVAGVPQAWLNNAVALGGDLAIVALGMNERGDVDTEDRMVILIREFQDAGADVIVVGCQRPRSTAMIDWRLTNRALKRAADFCGAAFISMVPLYDEGHIHAMGISQFDTCAANKSNHPGLIEHDAIGDELAKVLID